MSVVNAHVGRAHAAQQNGDGNSQWRGEADGQWKAERLDADFAGKLWKHICCVGSGDLQQECPQNDVRPGFDGSGFGVAAVVIAALWVQWNYLEVMPIISGLLQIGGRIYEFSLDENGTY